MTQKFKVGLVQMAMSADPQENVEKAAARVADAARKGAQVVCLPELFRSPVLLPEGGRGALRPRRDRPRPVHRAARRGGAQGRRRGDRPDLREARARALPQHRGGPRRGREDRSASTGRCTSRTTRSFYEKFYFTPGDLGFQAFDTRFGKIGTLICWDQWYPEGARLTALQGAPILFYPTAIGWHPHEKAQHGAAQRDAWRTIQRGHAIANGCYVAAVNRVGHERRSPGEAGLEFWGTSFLCDPFGVVIAEASTDQEEILVGEVDLARIEEVRRDWPFLRDRRIDAYAGIEKRFIDG